jgi:hypothetical protein
MPVSLPAMPARIARLPKDERGYPVPRFVEWMKDGEATLRPPPGMKPLPGSYPDFRYANADFRSMAFKLGLCWVCGERLGVHRVYVLGPMCVINRVTSEPASHRECAEFAARACPFLVKPRMRRIPLGADDPAFSAGTLIDRNPGCLALYETPVASAFRASGGWLIRVGKPDRVDWWAEGRHATLAEIMASIDSGYPLLMDLAVKEGERAVEELEAMRAEAMQLLPAA